MLPPLVRDDLCRDRGKAYQVAGLTAASKRKPLVSGTNGLGRSTSCDLHTA